MSRTDPPLRIRLPEALKVQIQLLAVENRRSMNAEIVARLAASVRQPEASEDNQSAALEIERLRTELRLAESERSAHAMRLRKLEYDIVATNDSYKELSLRVAALENHEE
ncbi:Arc family DNA-binding protein [Rhizobium leguminosarum]|uniref:Arc family DNA-binding protein n=1 Tax=Rhizobium TaxID=379 RepID=UPI00102FF0DF|nr:Arc family DNA-binding protein [Rhizobium leguminosarum]TAV54935.1 Arc family DNA-binding protein [Rhizobium leguminosarum]